MDWRPGEHVTLIGANGTGKTELMGRLMEHRRWNLFLSTKRIDETQREFPRIHHLRVIKDASELTPEYGQGFYFKPDWPRRVSSKQRTAYLAAKFRDILEASFWQGGWTTYADELRLLCHHFGLAPEMVEQFTQGRSQLSSVVSGAQRPRFVPLEAYDQASWMYFWKSHDFANIARISEMGGLNRERLTTILPQLDRHTVACIATFTGDMFLTNTRW